MSTYQKQTWTAREGSGLTRFRKTSESTDYVNLSNEPSAITVAGTPFTVARANHMEDGIERAHIDADKNLMFPRNDWEKFTILDDGQESCRIVNGTDIETFFADTAGVLKWGITNDYYTAKIGSLTTTDATGSRFNYIYKIGSNYYQIYKNESDGHLYMRYSTNKTGWGPCNGGNPVLTKSTDPDSIYYNLWNPGFLEIGGTVYFFVECGKSVDQSDVGIAYSYAVFSGLNINFDANRTATHAIVGGGQPNPVLFADEGYLVLFYGSIGVQGRDFWEIRASYAVTPSDFGSAASWTESPYFQIKYDNMHTADPDFVDFGVSKKHRLGIGFMWNQNASDLIYMDMTPAELIDGIINGYYQPKTFSRPYMMTPSSGLALTCGSGSVTLDAASFFAWEVQGNKVFFQLSITIATISTPGGRASVTLPFRLFMPTGGYALVNGMTAAAGSNIFDISNDIMYIDRYDAGAQITDLASKFLANGTIKVAGFGFVNLKQ